MRNWYKVYVARWNKETQEWELSAIAWWKYLLARAYNVCGPANSRDHRLGYDMYHVPRKRIIYM